MIKKRSYINIALVFLAAAGLLRYGIAPLLERLPAGYSNEFQLTVSDQFRDSPTGEWQNGTLVARRVDQVISTLGDIVILEGSLHVYFDTGAVNFELTSLYGVDRRSRSNQAGYGTLDRSGQYLFPTHVAQKTYPIWDPMFLGLRQATYDHTENLDGLQVDVFKFTVTGIDETEGYSFLKDVPGRYQTFTDGQGTIWIEPLSGWMVNYADQGVSYFVESTNGTRLANGEFHRWTQKFTTEMLAAQIALARTARLHILALEVWLPGGLLLVGLILVIFWRLRRQNTTEKHFAREEMNE